MISTDGPRHGHSTKSIETLAESLGILPVEQQVDRGMFKIYVMVRNIEGNLRLLWSVPFTQDES